MNFSLTAEQLALQASAAEFAKGRLNDGYGKRERRGEFSFENWRACADFGVQGAMLPERYGGRAYDPLTAAALLEGLGYGCLDNGLLFSLGAQILSVQVPILLFGSDELKDRYLPGLAGGALIGAHCVTEPEAGSDAFSLQTTAARDGDSYVLNGHKTYITSAPIADAFLIVANLDPARGSKGLTAFLVDKGTPGLSVPPTLEKMGLRTAQMGEVLLHDCRVPAHNRLGVEGSGGTVFNAAMEWERALILAPALGSMRRQLEECITRARTRRQFGKAIGKNQAISNKIVEMHVRLQSTRWLLYHVAALKSAGKRLLSEPSEVKLQVSETWVHNCEDAMQIHGAQGYLTEFGVERELRDALASRIYSGTSEIQKLIIAGFLGV
jgi:alkylation response protein AidB-like acyl-CoA dehydrogenase